MSDLAPRLERLFDAAPAEAEARLAVEGELPAALRGSARWIGPARFGRGGLRYRNWLDGDGMVLALRFGAEGVDFTARWVRGEKWRAEEEAGRPLYRAFGTAFPGDRLVRGAALASPLNVSVYPWGGRLLAFGEQGLPVALDERTLATVGVHDFGRLHAITPFSAHPAIDPDAGELWNFGVSFAAERPQLQLFRFSPQGELLLRQRLPLERPVSLHDFSLSASYAVFYLSPYVLEIGPLLESGATVLDCLHWRPELGTTLLVVERAAGRVAASIPIGHRYCLHQVNAFEEDGRLVVDVLELEEPVYPDYQGLPDLFVDVEPARTVRMVVDPARGELLERWEHGPHVAADFPSHDPHLLGRPYRHFWMLGISRTGRHGRKFFDRLLHFDWQRRGVAGEWGVEPPVYLGGEPVFAPDASGASPGWVICQELDAENRRAAFLVFAALDIARGPIARLPLATPVTAMFHGVFHA
jgi:all-trans-8'-apo-beta-carotenal 15,15'-oxygenase